MTDETKALEERIARLEGMLSSAGRSWGPVVDPAPWPQPQPTPFPFPRWPSPIPWPVPGGGVVDPAPIDISKLTKSQLETALHSVNAEKARLESLENSLNEQLKALKKGG